MEIANRIPTTARVATMSFNHRCEVDVGEVVVVVVSTSGIASSSFMFSPVSGGDGGRYKASKLVLAPSMRSRK